MGAVVRHLCAPDRRQIARFRANWQEAGGLYLLRRKLGSSYWLN